MCGSKGLKKFGGTIIGSAVGGPLGTAMGLSYDLNRQNQKNQSEQAKQANAIQKQAMEEAAEAQRASVAATPNRGGSIDMATQLGSKRRRGIQQTFLASRGESGAQTLGE